MEENLLRILVVLFGVAVVAIILVQQPKDGSMGGSFGGGGSGGGASGTVFGAKGATSFFFKLTGFLSIIFVVAILILVKSSNKSDSTSVISDIPVTEIVLPENTGDKIPE